VADSAADRVYVLIPQSAGGAGGTAPRAVRMPAPVR
jgi:hypothetical protein